MRLFLDVLEGQETPNNGPFEARTEKKKTRFQKHKIMQASFSALQCTYTEENPDLSKVSSLQPEVG